MAYRDILTIEPGKRGGKPCIRGMRITVYDVLEHLASGMTHEEILADFPYLREEDNRACLLMQRIERERFWLLKYEVTSRPESISKISRFPERVIS